MQVFFAAGGSEEHEEVGAEGGRGVEGAQVEELEVVYSQLHGEVGEEGGEDWWGMGWEGRELLAGGEGREGLDGWCVLEVPW